MTVNSGGIANDTVVGSSIVSSGKNSSTLKTSMSILGGVVNRTTVSSGGIVYASGG